MKNKPRPTGPVSREALLEFLLNPASYPHRTKRIRHVQTHSSDIFFASRYVYKVRKPVNFGFLDFSTLRKRCYYCHREVELNRRLSPDLHRGVEPIVLHDNRLAFDKPGEAVEYAVVMRKLSKRYFLKEMLARGEVGHNEIDRIVTILLPFYTGQKRDPKIAQWGKQSALQKCTDENFKQARPFIGTLISRPAFEAVRNYTRQFYHSHRQLLADRVRQGWIRDGHGDLHLEHIHLGPRQVTIYDCIEFNDRFRYLDVANDIAFLAMDLDYHGHHRLASCFVSRMIKGLGDPQMQRLMAFYQCYRAYVRGKVEGINIRASELVGPEARRVRHEAQRYFQLALQYAVAGTGPVVLIVMGSIGTGKSTLAQRLARELGWEVAASDVTRKNLAGFPLHRRGDVETRRQLYSAEMTQRTYDTLKERAVEHLQQGKSLIIDATFSRRRYRDRLRRQLRGRGRVCFVLTEAKPKTIRNRLLQREQETDVVSDARQEDYEVLSRMFEAPTELAQDQLIKLNTDRQLESTVSDALKQLAAHNAKQTPPNF